MPRVNRKLVIQACEDGRGGDSVRSQTYQESWKPELNTLDTSSK